MDGAWLILLLFIGALALILLELLTPTFGVLGLLALGCLAYAAYTGFAIDQWIGILVVVAELVLVPAYLALLIRRLPRSRLGKGLFLPLAGADRQPGGQVEPAGLVGKTGVALTPLRPIGTINIDGRRRQASADGGFIAAGQTVKVVRFDGMEIVVRAVASPARPAGPGGE